MANITNYLNKIKTAVYGKEVRGAIHDAIKECYDDASVNHDNANMEVKMARGTYNTLNDRLDKSDEIQAQTNAQLSHIRYYVTPEEFEGTDTEKVRQCIQKAIDDGMVALLKNNYTIERPLEFDGGFKKPIMIECPGSITPTTGGIYLTGFYGGYVKLKIDGGGNESLRDYGLKLLYCSYMDIDVEGVKYRGTVLKCGGRKKPAPYTRVSKMRVKVTARDNDDQKGCLRCLEHGDDASEVATVQDAFGSYESIIDFYSDYGILFQNSNDITIHHIENIFIDKTNTRNSVDFLRCGACHFNVIALGGNAKYLLNVERGSISINKLFLINNGDDGVLTTCGIKLKGDSPKDTLKHSINVLHTYGLKTDVTIENLSKNDVVNIQDWYVTTIAADSNRLTIDGDVVPTPSRNLSFHNSFIKWGHLDLYNLNDACYVSYRTKNNVLSSFQTGVLNSAPNEFNITAIERSDAHGTVRRNVFKSTNQGDVSVGYSSKKLGFYGSEGNAKQTLLNDATDLDSAIKLVNNIKRALINVGLVK